VAEHVCCGFVVVETLAVATSVGKVKPARVERGKLYYGDKIFNRGDYVLVRSELSEAEFSGKIVTVHENEVW
jgi:uncharacterized membrane protein (UPF0182 family)